MSKTDRLQRTQDRVYEALHSHETDTGWTDCRTSVVARRADVSNATALRHLREMYYSGRVSRCYVGNMFCWSTIVREETP